MTVITYSSAAGRLPKEIQVLEHPSASGNVPEPLSEILEPRTMPGPSENQIPGSCGVKGRRWIEQGDDDGGAKGEEAKRKGQTWGRGVSRERMNRGRGEEQCNLRNKCNKEVGKDLKSEGRCMEGKDKSKMGVSGNLSAAETEGEIKQREKRMGKRKRRPVFPFSPFHLKNIIEGDVKGEKSMMKETRWRHIFLWLTLLLFSLCPKPASSQVRVAFKSQF